MKAMLGGYLAATVLHVLSMQMAEQMTKGGPPSSLLGICKQPFTIRSKLGRKHISELQIWTDSLDKQSEHQYQKNYRNVS
jgi:hypothetical protein